MWQLLRLTVSRRLNPRVHRLEFLEGEGLVQDRGLVEAAIIKLAVTERLERLVEIQDRRADHSDCIRVSFR